MISGLISKFEACINGWMNREEISIWFNSISQAAEKHYTGASLDLIFEIEGIFAESSSGGWSEQGLKAELEAVIEPYRNQRVVMIGETRPNQSSAQLVELEYQLVG